MDVLKIGFTSDTRSPMELRALADWTIRPRLLLVPGVARVNVFGARCGRVQVQVSAPALRARGLGLADVVAGARAATAVRGAGFVDTPDSASFSTSPATRGRAATSARRSSAAPRRAVRLADVATGDRGACAALRRRPHRQRARGPPLALGAYGANTMEVTAGLERALDELAPLLAREHVTLHPALHGVRRASSRRRSPTCAARCCSAPCS